MGVMEEPASSSYDEMEAFAVEPVEEFEVADEVGFGPPELPDGVYISEEEELPVAVLVAMEEEEIVREEEQETLN
jgi:hypothetical protein